MRRLDRGEAAVETRTLTRSVGRVLRISAGCALLVAGAVMIVLPGPASLVLPLGAFVVAGEVPWARRRFLASTAAADRVLGSRLHPTSPPRRLLAIVTARLERAGAKAEARPGVGASA